MDVPSITQPQTQPPVEQNVSYTDVDQDDAALQQALRESRQQSQAQGSDPAASSSTSGQRSTQDELQDELEAGRKLQLESGQLEQKMAASGLTSDELERFRKVSQLWHTNKLRVTELVERQIHESQVQQSQSTHALLGNLQPLQSTRPKPQQILKSAPAPEASDSTAALEEKLRKRKEAKRQQPEEKGNDPKQDEARSKQQRTSAHRHKEDSRHKEDRHSTRDTRRSTNLKRGL